MNTIKTIFPLEGVHKFSKPNATEDLIILVGSAFNYETDEIIKYERSISSLLSNKKQTNILYINTNDQKLDG